MAEETEVQTQEVPLEESSMAEYKKARTDGKETATRETIVEEKTAPEEKEKPKAKGGFQARIDRLIKQQASTEERASAAEKRAAELEAKLSGNGTARTEPAVEGEPQRDQFQTDAEYFRALTRWEVKQELKAERESEEKEAVAAQTKEAVSNYNKKAIEAQSRYEDWKETMSQDITIPQIVGDAIIHSLKNGPDVAYFLGKNPEICEEMLSVHPLEAVAMAVKISESLENEQGQESDEEKAERERIEAEEAAKAAEKPARRAPAPIRPVSGGSSRSTIPLDKASFADYKKLRSQGRVQ